MNQLMNIIGLRLKLVYRNATIRVLVMVMTLIFAILIGSLYAHQEESTKIKMGYLDLDQSDFSKQVVKNMKENELLDPLQTTLKAGINSVKKGQIEVLVVISSGAEKQVQEGDFNQLMTLYYISENYLPPMIGDVVVGEMFEEISLITAINYLEELVGQDPNKSAILEEAHAYGDKLAKERKHEYYVTIEFMQIESKTSLKEENISNQIVYKQMILGIILSFLAFYMLFSATSIVKDEENKILEKIAITKTAKGCIVLGEYLSMIFSTWIIAFISSILSAYYSPNFMETFLMNMFVFIMYISSLAALILLVAKLFHQVSSFIVVGAALILVIGIVSGCFFNIDLTLPAVKAMAYFTPTYQALTQLMSIVVKEDFNDVGKYIFFTCLFSALGFLIALLTWFWNPKRFLT